MSTASLMNEINTRIDDGVDVSKHKQLKTALNQLIKRKLIDDSNIDDIFNDNNKLEELISTYKLILVNEEKKELRSPLTHVRNLAAFYVILYSFDSKGMSFNEAFRAAIKRQHKNIFDGEIDPKNNYEVRNKYTTYRSVIAKMVEEGQKKAPHLWPKQKAGTISAITRYARGIDSPGERVPRERIMFMEDYFSIPRGSLLDKIPFKVRGINEIDATRKKRTKRKGQTKLSASMQCYFDEYSDYRTKGIQPKIRLIPPEFNDMESHVRVSENYKSPWTYNKRGVCSSKDVFHQGLVAFTNFCINEFDMDPNDVGMEQITDIKKLEKWKDYVVNKGKGGNALGRTLYYIKRSVELRGYLRLCGDKGEKSIEEYCLKLNLLGSLIPEWEKAAEQLGTEKTDPKRNVRFLLDMPYQEMWLNINKATEWSFQHASNLILYPIKNNVEAAYLSTQALTILYLSRASPIRESNWTDLEINMNHKNFNYEVPSLTFYKSKNVFRIFVPTGYLKNRYRESIQPIDVFYPKSFTKVILKSLEYRQKYIDFVINKNGKHEHNPKKFVVKQHYNPSKTDPDYKFETEPMVLGTRFKKQTGKAFNEVLPGIAQKGINHHSTRHLAATWYLNKHPGKWTGLAKLLNDTIEVVIRDYAEINDRLAQEHINESLEEEVGELEIN